MSQYSSEVAEEMLLECSSVEEAIAQAAKSWGIEESEIHVEVLDQGKRFFGLLGKKVSVKLTPIAPLPMLHARHFTKGLLSKMELDAEACFAEDHMLDLVGEDSGIIIGRYGETLKAMELLVNLIVREPKSNWKVRLDCCGYRGRREASLIRLAESHAREATRRRRTVTLEPMSSWERRIVHLALQESVEVETYSVGEEPFRKVLVAPKSRGDAPSQRRRNRQ